MKARDGTITGSAGQEILHGLPLRWPWLLEVTSDAARMRAPAEISCFPVVAKAEGIAHRQQVSAVWRDVASPQMASLVLELFAESFGYPLSLTEQIRHDREFTVGWQRRPADEDILMFGAGGSDVGGDVDFRLLPLTRREAATLVHEYVADRSRQARLVALILALQDLIARIPAGAAEVREIDLNPITFDSDGELIALDWKVFRSD